MNKMAQVSVTYLYTFEPCELGLSNNCSNDEFYSAVEKHMEDELSTMPHIYNDLEIFISEE